MAANGIDAKTLKADLALIANGQIPPFPDPVPVPPVPGRLTLTATPASGNPPLTVAFAVGGNGVGGKLDFGDGQQSVVYPVNHTYANAGTYTATVKTATESASVVISVGVVPPIPVPGALGPVTTDPTTGTITFVGPWRVKGGVVPSLAAELADAGVPQNVIDAVLVLIDATRKNAAKLGQGMYLVPKRRYDREPVLAG